MRDLTLFMSLWNGWRPIYQVGHVRALARQIREYARRPPKLVLLTDDRHVSAADAEVDAVAPMPQQDVVASPEVPHRPNCFRRLRFFDPSWAASFGTSWIASIDLDMLVTGELDPLLDYATDAPSGFTAVRSRYDSRRDAQLYNAAFFALQVGAQRQIWDTFDWRTSPIECAATKQLGSDQVWMALKVDPPARVVGEEHGVYFFERHVELGYPQATVVSFAGITKPWSKTSKRTTPAYYEAFQRFAA